MLFGSPTIAENSALVAWEHDVRMTLRQKMGNLGVVNSKTLPYRGHLLENTWKASQLFAKQTQNKKLAEFIYHQ